MLGLNEGFAGLFGQRAARGGLMIEKRSIDCVPLAERQGKVWHLWPM
jgi:hypothetical protein